MSDYPGPLPRYKSPFELDTLGSSPWQLYRDAFVRDWEKPELAQRHYDHMLSCVTLDNPPDAPKAPAEPDYTYPRLTRARWWLTTSMLINWMGFGVNMSDAHPIVGAEIFQLIWGITAAVLTAIAWIDRNTSS